MPLAVFELLEELGLRLVVEVGVLGVLHILEPYGRVDYLGLSLHGAAHALVNREGYAVLHGQHATRRQFLLCLLHLSLKGGVLLSHANPGSLSSIHLIRGRLTDYIVVLYTDDLIDTVPESGHFLAALMQIIL